MTKQLGEEVLLHVLESLFPNGDRLLSSFIYGIPGAPHWQRRIPAEIFVKEHQYIEALLFLRRNGAPFLRDISIGDLWSMTTKFVVENYAYIGERRSALLPNISLAKQISPERFAIMSQAMMQSSLFNPTNKVTLYPLVPVVILDRFNSHQFAFSDSDDLAITLNDFGVNPSSLMSGQFPPIEGLGGMPIPTSNWLCVNAPEELVAHKRASAILGAVALTPIRRERYLKTGRSVHDGYCTLCAEMASCSSGTQAATPPIASNIMLKKSDHPWLNILSSLFDSPDQADKSRVRALEYFYRAWFDGPRERFPTLCMALDSLVASQGSHTKSTVNFVIATIDEPVNRDRLRLLMSLRGAVIHGAAPDVYDSEHYETYYSKYGEDPIQDLELVVAACLRKGIFRGALVAHPDPCAEIVKQMQASGRAPHNSRGRSIIEDD